MAIEHISNVLKESLVPSMRWRKLLRDVLAEKRRFLSMLVAIAVSVVAIGVVMGAYAVLTREIEANYLGTNPAAATLELVSDVDARVLSIAQQYPQIRDAEAREVVLARARVGADWRPMLLFVVDDFNSMRVNIFKSIQGAWPPAMGEMLVERTATGLLGAGMGARVLIKTAHGTAREVPISGVVHDPGLAPANQERTAYGYISRETLASHGEVPVLHELRITMRDSTASITDIETLAAELARSLAHQGIVVHEIRVPPLRQHPHQLQMKTTMFMLMAFSVMALVLSGILVASSLAAMLARQIREIGIMKTIGARSDQLFAMYALMVASLGAIAVLPAVPLGWLGSQIFARAIASMLNFELIDRSVPHWVFFVQACAGVVVPLVVAAFPISRASSTSVRQAIGQYGASPQNLSSRSAKLPWAARNALRRPVRLVLAIALLAAGGAMFMTALNVSQGWERNIAKIYETRFYDVELRFHEAPPIAVVEQIRLLPGVKSVEAWAYSLVAFSRSGQINVVRNYPDRRHASFTALGIPNNTNLVRFPLVAGRWLTNEDSDVVVLNHVAVAQFSKARIGERLELSLDGKPAALRLVGIVEEVGSGSVAYLNTKTFARIMGSEGRARVLRVAIQARSAQARIEAIRAIERRLADLGVGVETAMPLAELRTAMADHIVILSRALIAIAFVMAVVGALGLASTMGISVVERTREFAVMKTVGATPQRIIKLLLGEAVFIGALSWIAALILALPLTWLVDALVGRLGFVAPLPFVISPFAALVWLLLIGVAAILATLLPARRASQLSVAQALASL